MNKIEQNTGKPTAMYIHGLASGSNSNTGRELQKLFPQYQWILPEVGEELEQAIDKINDIVAQYNPKIVMGTSYGGLMTMYANAPNATKIICNPAINADVSYAAPRFDGFMPTYWSFTFWGENGMLSFRYCDNDIHIYKGKEEIITTPNKEIDYLNDFAKEIKGEAQEYIGTIDMLSSQRQTLMIQKAAH
jgi:hypothetical protein